MAWGGDTVGRYRGAITVTAVAAGVVDIAGARLAQAGSAVTLIIVAKTRGNVKRGGQSGGMPPVGGSDGGLAVIPGGEVFGVEVGVVRKLEHLGDDDGQKGAGGTAMQRW